MQQIKPTSLRETILAQIGAFLYEEGFPKQPYTAEGLFEIVNLISDYQEEGKILFPEVLVTSNVALLDTIPDHKVEIGEIKIHAGAYKQIIKSCAPLCSSEWVIYIEIGNGRLKYGLTCAEITETTPSLYKQTVGDLRIDIEGCNVAYIHNIGKKTVELKGLRSTVLVSLSLSDPADISIDETGELAANICADLQGDIKSTSQNYFGKILSEALKEGHGNLIGVVKDSEDAIQLLKRELPDGIYLPSPIDLVDLLRAFEVEKSGANSVALRQYASVVKAMCNNDGMTVFSTSGKLLGYHIMVNKDFLTEEIRKNISGGARTRAFHNIEHSGLFSFGFIKSQDGPIKTF